MAEFPHERSLVNKFADKPFVLLGVNSDTDRKMFEKRLQRFKINWRSFWNGPSGPRGPISRAWNARWPYGMLLDAEGVVRYVDLHGPELEEAIEVLLAEMEEG